LSVGEESGARPEEVLGLRVRSVSFDEYGAVIVVRGKKGERRVRLVTLASYFAAWLDIHPRKGDPDERLWVNISSTNRGEAFE
jgi:integrase